MGKICWLASYPKSGNTWLRALLANYVANGDRPVDVNALDSASAASRSLFDELVGIEASALDVETIDNLRPEVYRCLARESEGLLFLKVHDMFRRNHAGQSLFPADASAGAVYVVRNVLDVALSFAGHAGVELPDAVDKLCDPAYTAARSEDRLEDQLQQTIGSWSSHAASWLDQNEIPVHAVRYEDLLRDPAATFGGVVRFCGLEFDEARVRKAVAFSSFEELQRQEQSHGFRERLEQSTAAFFRRGETGAGKRELPQDLARRLVLAHGEMLRRLGYQDDGLPALNVPTG